LIHPPLAIIDTNVLVSGLITNNAAVPTSIIVDGMLSGMFAFLLSVELLREYRDVLLRPAIRKYHGLNETAIDSILETVTANAILRESAHATDAAPDPGDQHLWNLLAAVPGSVLVTGDALLLEQPPAVARVLSPKSFLDIG